MPSKCAAPAKRGLFGDTVEAGPRPACQDSHLSLIHISFDLTVIISGRSLREVAQFVGERLAPLEGVTGTATHFILKKYKEKHLIFRPQEPQEREYIFV